VIVEDVAQIAERAFGRAQFGADHAEHAKGPTQSRPLALTQVAVTADMPS
jgi:hypothetical protein